MLKLDNFINESRSNGLLIVPFGASRVRAVAHLNVDDQDVKNAAAILIKTAKSLI